MSIFIARRSISYFIRKEKNIPMQKTANKLFVSGDQAALYEAKRGNRSRYVVFGEPEKLRRVLIHGAAFVITIDENDSLVVKKNHSIYIVDGKIKDVFPVNHKSIPINKIDMIYDGSKRGGIVVTPGFINGHAHPPMYLLRSTMSLDRGNVQSQVRKMATLEHHMNQEDLFYAALGDLTEQQKNGITTVLSHYATFGPIDRAAEVTKQNVINAISAVSNSHPENTPALVEKILKNKDRTFSTPAIAIHYLHKASASELKKIGQLIKKYNVLFTLHVGECEEWVQECVQRHGKRTIEALKDFGLANSNTIISHAVCCSDKEIELIAKHKIGVVHLPTSNKLHKSGELKYLTFLQKKAHEQICLGTDSVVSKNTLDLLSEALQTRIIHLDKHRILYEDLFKMMTSQAAKILKLGKVGRILPGYKADLSFWKLKDRGFLPYNESKPVTLIGNMITHGGRNIRDLMINGEFIISNRVHNLIRESELLTNLQKSHRDLIKRQHASPSTESNK